MNENIINDTAAQNVEMTAGEMLKNARTTGRRKREIPTIAKQLCIREEFLQALEDGDYSVIPEPVYILGFARNYAMELGLNPDEVVAKIKREMGLVSDCASDGDVDNSVCNIPSVRGVKILGRAMTFVRRKWKLVLAVVGAIIVSIALIFGFVSILGGASSGSASDEKTVVAENVQTVVEPAYNKSVRERFGTENREKANVILQALRDSWIKVEDARGRTEFSRVLVKGDIYYVPADGKFSATFGDAGGIDIWVNGKLAPKAGPDHERKSDISLVPEKLMPAGANAGDAKPETKSE